MPKATINAALLKQLLALRGPAWLIDVAQARVLWTNGEGRKRLNPDDAPALRGGQLDRNMPAMQQLRERHRESRVQILTFWTSSGVLHQRCTIDMINSAAGKAGDMALVRCRDDKAAALDAAAPTVNTASNNRPNRVAPSPPAIAGPRAPLRSLYADLQQQNGRRRTNDNAPAPFNRVSSAYAGARASKKSTAQPAHAISQPVNAQSADAQTLQEIARRIRQASSDHDASPFSLEALHAAARDHDPGQDQSRDHDQERQRDNLKGRTQHIDRSERAAAPRRSPPVINFKQAAAAATAAPRFAPAAAIINQPGQPQSQPPPTTTATTATTTATATTTKPGMARSATLPEPTNGDTAITSVKDPVAKLAHELRTPISAIHTAAELLAQEQFGPIGSARYQGYAQDIQQSAAHVLSVIAAMLDPDYLQSGKPRLEPRPLDLSALVKTTVSGIRPLAQAAGLTISCRCKPGLPLVMADARALRQILLNLLTNAIKFTPKRGKIKVDVRRTGQGELRIIIADTGPGMSKAAIKTIMAQRPDGRDQTDQPIETSQEDTLQCGGARMSADGSLHTAATAHGPTRPVSAGMVSGGAHSVGSMAAGPMTASSLAGGQGYGLPLVITLARALGARFKLSSAKNKGLSASLIFPPHDGPAAS